MNITHIRPFTEEQITNAIVNSFPSIIDMPGTLLTSLALSAIATNPQNWAEWLGVATTALTTSAGILNFAGIKSIKAAEICYVDDFHNHVLIDVERSFTATSFGLFVADGLSMILLHDRSRSRARAILTSSLITVVSTVAQDLIPGSYTMLGIAKQTFINLLVPGLVVLPDFLLSLGHNQAMANMQFQLTAPLTAPLNGRYIGLITGA